MYANGKKLMYEMKQIKKFKELKKRFQKALVEVTDYHIW